MDDNHIEHFGIKGQKWGLRRYQNEDGTLTDEGRKRYGVNAMYDSKSNTWRSSDARNLTDDELNRRNSRLQREKQYRELTTPPVKKEFANAAHKILIGSAIAITVGVVTSQYKKLAGKGLEWLKNTNKVPWKYIVNPFKGV